MSADVKSLTDEQRELVEKNHSLIYSYAFKNKVSLDEFYGVLAAGLCKAAQAYDKTRGSFSTFAYRCMQNEYFGEWNRMKNKSHIPKDAIYYYEESLEKHGEYYEVEKSDNFIDYDCYNDVEYKMILDSMYAKLTPMERDIVALHMDGLNYSNIANVLGCSKQCISYHANKARRKVKQELYNKD